MIEHENLPAGPLDVAALHEIRLLPLSDLGFEESLNPALFEDKVAKQICAGLNGYLQRAGSTTLLSLDQLTKIGSGTMQAVFSPEVQQALKSGTASMVVKRSGVVIAQARDQASGGILETAKIAQSGAVSLTSIGVAAAFIVVQVAHFISAADILHKLTEANKKLNFLLEYRRIDQIAQLERIYYTIQVLTSSSRSPSESAQHLRDVMTHRGELIELRSKWRREAVVDLRELKNPEGAGWFTSASSIGDANEVYLRRAVSRILLIEYTLRLDSVLMIDLPDSGTLQQSLPFEINETKSVLVKLASQARLVPNKMRRMRWIMVAQLFYDRIGCFGSPISADQRPVYEAVFDPKDWGEDWSLRMLEGLDAIDLTREDEEGLHLHAIHFDRDVGEFPLPPSPRALAYEDQRALPAAPARPWLIERPFDK